MTAAPHPESLRAACVAEFDTRTIKWSAYNVSRLLRLTGERPGRIAEMWAILGKLGIGFRPWVCKTGQSAVNLPPRLNPISDPNL